MMAFSGVRSSWLMLARNSDLARLAASARSLASSQFVRSFDLGRDIATGAAITHEGSGRIEHRVAVDADMVEFTVLVGLLVAEIAKRPPCQHIACEAGPNARPLRSPSSAARASFPMRLGNAHRLNHRAVGYPGETQFRVEFPEPVRRHFGEISHPCFAGAQRIRSLRSRALCSA